MTDATPPPSPTVSVTVEIPPERRGEFLRLVQEFNAGRVHATSPVFDFEGKDYREAVRDLVSARSTSPVLRKRLVEDDGRDAGVTLTEAETLHAVQSKRFTEAAPIGAVDAPGAGGLEEAGVEALRRLYKVACGHSGQCRKIARFLLGLYNGDRFPFDLTELRAIDDALFDDCVRVLNMDARLNKREVHTYFDDGSRKWEALASDWRVVDVCQVQIAAKNLAEHVGFSGPSGRAAAELLDLIDGKRGAREDE